MSQMRVVQVPLASWRKQDNASKSMTDELSLPLINCMFNNNGIMYY